MDRGAWWAAVHRVAQSRTQLKRLSIHASIGEGNGNPLQYSCLENPRDRGAWWAAVYGVAHSWTRLKQLSSSSIYNITLSASRRVLLFFPIQIPFIIFFSSLIAMTRTSKTMLSNRDESGNPCLVADLGSIT